MYRLSLSSENPLPLLTCIFVSSPGPALITRLMTQRWLELGETWTADDHHTAHASLSYEYRVVCQEHYYGEGCRKWCKPRNDSFGHYVCNATGYLVCLEGWQGTKNYCITREYPLCNSVFFEMVGGTVIFLINVKVNCFIFSIKHYQPFYVYTITLLSVSL